MGGTRPRVTLNQRLTGRRASAAHKAGQRDTIIRETLTEGDVCYVFFHQFYTSHDLCDNRLFRAFLDKQSGWNLTKIRSDSGYLDFYRRFVFPDMRRLRFSYRQMPYKQADTKCRTAVDELVKSFGRAVAVSVSRIV